MKLELILAAALTAFFLFSLARTLRTGRIGYGEHAICRDAEPARFRRHFWFGNLVAPLLVAALIYEALVEEPPYLPVSILIVAATSAYAAIAALQTGEALDPAFNRLHEPRQYWAIVAGLFAFSALCLAFVVSAIARSF